MFRMMMKGRRRFKGIDSLIRSWKSTIHGEHCRPPVQLARSAHQPAPHRPKGRGTGRERGAGVNTNIELASIQAVISALNRV